MTVDQYIRSLPVDFVRRMRNWAAESRGDGYGHVKAMDYGAVVSGGYRDAPVPILTGEADDTEAALTAVPIRYRQAVVKFWKNEGRSWVLHGQDCCVTDKTFLVWLQKGHDLLAVELAKRSAAVSARQTRGQVVRAQSLLIRS